MAQASYPFENIDVSETQFSRWARNFQETGVKGVPNDLNLKVTADNSGMQVRIAAGEAFVRGHYFENTLQATLAIDSTDAQTRIDAIVLELSHIENKIQIKAIKGAQVDSSPVAPTLTQTESVWQLPLAYLTIPNNTTSILDGMLSDVRTFMSHRIGVWTTATRPTNPVAQLTFGYNTTLGFHEVWSGTEWRAFQPDVTSPFLLMGA